MKRRDMGLEVYLGHPDDLAEGYLELIWALLSLEAHLQSGTSDQFYDSLVLTQLLDEDA